MSEIVLSADRVLPVGGRLSEGPLYDNRNNVLAWVDIIGQKIHWVDFDGEDLAKTWKSHKFVNVESPIGFIALTKEPLVYVCGYQDGFAKVDLRAADAGAEATTANGASVSLQILEKVQHEHPGKLRFNDGSVDPKGAVFASTMKTFGVEGLTGNLYHFTATKNDSVTQETLRGGLVVGNGIAWSPDKTTMYFVESAEHIIHKVPYNEASGKADFSKAQVFIKIEGYQVESPEPDGMCVSEDGDLWVAVWSTGTFRRYDSSGALKTQYRIPKTTRVSCTAFAGKQLDYIVVTTASLTLDADAGPYQTETDLGGNVFVFKMDGVKGIPENVSYF